MNPPLTALPAFHLRLRRLRRARGLKQAYVAALLEVDQSTVSRWESGALVPEPEVAQRALRSLAAAPSDDYALRRLVCTSNEPCHLVTDVDHRLLAVSRPRECDWKRPAGDLMGTSLWRFATPEIVEAEERLVDLRWWELAAPPPVVLHTREGCTDGLHILAGDMVWERVWLANGEPARLCVPWYGERVQGVRSVV
ncbi:MAG TPA: helix-turn-helix transcriptional regulator [Burkholderiaceae bacterium]|nr:helix-turn-helix transcriptional regulator [Burkholderiaceae bacterium]